MFDIKWQNPLKDWVAHERNHNQGQRVRQLQEQKRQRRRTRHRRSPSRTTQKPLLHQAITLTRETGIPTPFGLTAPRQIFKPSNCYPFQVVRSKRQLRKASYLGRVRYLPEKKIDPPHHQNEGKRCGSGGGHCLKVKNLG